MAERKTAVTGGADDLEARMVTLETKVEERDTLQPARKNCQSKAGVQVREAPKACLVGDSRVRHQNQEFVLLMLLRGNVCVYYLGLLLS